VKESTIEEGHYQYQQVVNHRSKRCRRSIALMRICRKTQSGSVIMATVAVAVAYTL
jgi:hypothetical protein